MSAAYIRARPIYAVSNPDDHRVDTAAPPTRPVYAQSNPGKPRVDTPSYAPDPFMRYRTRLTTTSIPPRYAPNPFTRNRTSMTARPVLRPPRQAVTAAVAPDPPDVPLPAPPA